VFVDWWVINVCSWIGGSLMCVRGLVGH